MEDDEDDRDFFRHAFQSIGDGKIECITLNSGEELFQYLERLHNRRSDDSSLIILDINMPQMNGLSVLKSLKGKPDTRNIPVYLLSTTEDISLKKQCLDLGSEALYQKPVRNEDLKKVIRDIIQKSGH